MGLGFLFKATDEASPVMKGIAGNLAKTGEASHAASVSMKDIGNELGKMSAAAGIAGASIAAGLGLAVSEAAKFQFGVAQVVTESDRAKLPAANIAKLAKDMATTYGGDLDTQIKAAYQGVAAGADTAAKSLDLLNGANRLAIAGNTSQETALLGITKVLNNYNLTFDKSSEVADAFFVAVKSGQTTVGELGEAIGQVAALSKNAGLSMEEMIGALGTAATLGKDTASSAAAMKAALSGIAHPTSEAAAEAAKLGIKFDSASLRSMGLVKFLGQITNSSKYSADSMNKLFGSVEASGFMSALAANKMGPLNDMMAGMAKKAGGAEEAFQTMSATLQQTASVLKANVQVALVDLGTAFLPVITGAVAMATSVLKAFNSLPDPVKKGVAVFLAIAAAALIFSGIVGGLVAVLLTSEIPIIAVGAALAVFVQAMLPIIVVGGVLIATVLAVKRAFDENVGGLRDTVIPITKKIQLAWEALSQAFSQGGFSGAVREELNKAENQGIKNFAVNAYVWFKRIENFFTGLKKGFEDASNAAGPTFAKLSLAFDKLAAAFGKLFGGKQDPAKAAAMFDKFGSAGESLGGTIERIAEVVVGAFTSAMEWVASFMTALDTLPPSFGRLWDSAKVLFSALGDLGSALGQLVGAFSTSGASASQSGMGFAAFIAAIADSIAIAVRFVAFMVSVFTPMFRGIAIVVGFVKDLIIDTFKGIVSGILLVSGVIAQAIDEIGRLMGKDVGAGKLMGKLGAKDITTGKTMSTGSGGPMAPPDFGPQKLAPMANPEVSVTAAPTLASKNMATPAPFASPAASAGGGAAGQTTSQLASSSAVGPGPGLTQDQMSAAMAGAMKSAPPPTVTLQAPIFLDGDKIGEAVAQKGSQNAARSFSPAPSPSG